MSFISKNMKAKILTVTEFRS